MTCNIKERREDSSLFKLIYDLDQFALDIKEFFLNEICVDKYVQNLLRFSFVVVFYLLVRFKFSFGILTV